MLNSTRVCQVLQDVFKPCETTQSGCLIITIPVLFFSSVKLALCTHYN